MRKVFPQIYIVFRKATTTLDTTVKLDTALYLGLNTKQNYGGGSRVIWHLVSLYLLLLYYVAILDCGEYCITPQLTYAIQGNLTQLSLQDQFSII